MASPLKPPHTCWICGKPVSLEARKIDEHGLPVHEECSVAKIASKAASTPASEFPKLRSDSSA
jgi:hypothetical protein